MEIERTFEQWSLGSPRIKWSAVFAGWAVGLSVQMLLTLLGLGIGAWAVDFQDADPTGGIPLGAGIWTGASMLIAAFIGGYVTARSAGSYLRSDGVYYGIVVWAIPWLIFAWLITTAMATMVGGAFSAFGSTLQTLGQGASNVASTAASKINGHVSVSLDELRKHVESALSATGKSELQPGELRQDADRVSDAAATSGQPIRRVSDSALRELQKKLAALDRDAAVNVLVTQFGLSDQQAQEVVQSTIGVMAPLQDTMQRVKQRSAALGSQALERVGTIALWLAMLSLITLCVSALGGRAGTPEDSMLETRTQSEAYRTDLRRAG